MYFNTLLDYRVVDTDFRLVCARNQVDILSEDGYLVLYWLPPMF